MAAQPQAQAPNPLKLLSGPQITKQATNTISKSYAPSYLDLKQQGNEAKAISAKRTSDNKYFQSWLDTQAAALQAHADAAHAQLSGLTQQLTNEQNQLYGGEAPVGGAEGQALGTNQTGTKGQLNSSALGSVANIATGTDALGSARANNENVILSGQQKQTADLNTALTNIANQRSKLQSSETGDIAKEIARLQGVNISVAQSDRSYNAAAEKLGLSAANTNSEITARAQAAQTALTRAQNQKMESDRTFQLDKQKLGDAEARNNYELTHGLGPYKVAKTATGATHLSLASSDRMYQSIEGTRGEIRTITSGGYLNGQKLTKQQAYHIIANGGTYQVQEPNADGTTVWKNVKATKSPGNEVLNAAFNLETEGSINTNDLKALNRLGLYGVKARYKVTAPKTVGRAIKQGSGT